MNLIVSARDCFVSWGDSIGSETLENKMWDIYKDKWGIPESMDFDQFYDLPVSQSLFKDGQEFVPYQSDDGESDAVLNREPRLLCARNLKRKTA